MTKTLFISGADRNYFPMLLEWVYALRACDEAKDAPVAILDAGLTDDQKKIIAPLVTHIHSPDWPFPVAAHKVRGREYLKSCLCRPFINRYFPGYDIYFWMDADTWVQNPRAIPLFIEGANRRKIALTGQVDRAYPRQLRVKWLGPWPWKVRGFYFSNALKAFGFEKAREILPYHVLLAGAFALHKDAPHWDRWQHLVRHTADRGKLFTAEQLSLGIMCYLENYPFELLPAWTHWLCEFKPLYDTKRKKFVEPFLPHEEIGILHLSGFDEMRRNRALTTDFTTTDGETIALSYRYPGFDGEKDEPERNAA